MADEKTFPAPGEDKPGYWAVLPSNVRYDDRLRPNGKILYAEITALASRDGYCWADNKYFAELYHVTDRSIRTLLQQLESLGYIQTEIVKKGNQTQKEQRRIWIDKEAFAMVRSGTKIPQHTPSPEQNFRAPEQNFQTTINNNKKEYNTCAISTMSDFKRDRFEGFWKFYKSTVPSTVSVGAKQRALKAWNKLKPDDETINAMGKALMKQSALPDWQRGVGIPHASTWLNQARWTELPECGEAVQKQQRPEREVEQW